MEKCSAKVSTRQGAWSRFVRCSRNGVITRSGKWYCKQHDPEAVKKREEESRAKYEVERRKRRVQFAAPEMLTILKDFVATDISNTRKIRGIKVKANLLIKSLEE